MPKHLPKYPSVNEGVKLESLMYLELTVCCKVTIVNSLEALHCFYRSKVDLVFHYMNEVPS